MGTTRAVTRSAWSVSGNPPSGSRRIHPRPIERSRIGLHAAEVTLPRIRPPIRNGTPRSSAPPRSNSRPTSFRSIGRPGEALERAGGREALRGSHRTVEAELRRRVVRERVLSDVEMSLLEPEDLERVEPVRTESERGAFPDERRPEVRSSRPRMMELEAHLADEAAPDRAARDARHAHLADPERREGLGIERRVRELAEERSRERPRDHDRPPLGREVDDVRPEPPAVGVVPEPGLHPIRASRRRREVPAFLAERAREAVVEHVARFVEGEQVARPTGSDVGEPRGEGDLHQVRGVRSRDEELRERPHVHHRHALADGPVLVRRVAVVERPQPGSGPSHPCARRDVRVVQGGALLDHGVDGGGERAQRHGPRGRARRRPCGGVGGRSSVFRAAANAARCRPHIAPWHGPIVAVVYRFESSDERYPSAQARSRSATDTSSQRHTVPAVDPGTACARDRGVTDDLDRIRAGHPDQVVPRREAHRQRRTGRSRSHGSRPRRRGARRSERRASRRRAGPRPPPTS